MFRLECSVAFDNTSDPFKGMSESFLRREAYALQYESVDFLPEFSRNELPAETAATRWDSDSRGVSEFGRSVMQRCVSKRTRCAC